ncbi:MAG: Fe-S cluster assembly protein SufD [Alphaproteobacteria bacterium]
MQETGLPTPKLERWKYTNLPAKLKKMDLVYKDADITLSGMTDYAYSFPKGMLHFPQWAQDRVEEDVPSHDKYGDMMLWQAANAYLKDGFILDIPAGVKSSKPLNVTMAGHAGAYFVPRQVIRVGEGAEFTLIEYQNGSGAYWGNIVTQIELHKGAKLNHYRFQENSENGVVTQNTHIVMKEEASYESFTLTTGAELSRHQIHVDMKGQRGECHINGVNMLDGSKLSDTTITIDHCASNCVSNQNYRNVVDDKATAVFQGKVHVHQIAQKTDGYQMAKSLLLSGQATVNTKPELEIYADDVKCSHGATTGRLDEEALFYLRARGIPEKQARNLLIQAFVNEVIENISSDEVREQSELVVGRWLMEQA